MAKKVNQTPNKPKEFNNIPFGPLKGIVVPEAVPVKPEPQTVRQTVEQADNGMDLFMRAVSDVKPIRGKNKTAIRGTDALQKTDDEKIIKFPDEECVSNLFLEEISRLKLDTKFTDSLPDDGDLKMLPGNRLRQVKRGVVSVEYQLDLHGLRREEALAALPLFLQSALQKGQKAVLVITGKGNHSAEEPVLQHAVASWLREAGRSLVLEFAPAPRELGGSGALVVFLRPATPAR